MDLKAYPIKEFQNRVKGQEVIKILEEIIKGIRKKIREIKDEVGIITMKRFNEIIEEEGIKKYMESEEGIYSFRDFRKGIWRARPRRLYLDEKILREKCHNYLKKYKKKIKKARETQTHIYNSVPNGVRISEFWES